MNAVPEPHLADAKVIAAGSISNDFVRATVMLTPGYGKDEGGPLSEWPRRMLDWLEFNNWSVCLELKPILYQTTDDQCQIVLGSGVLVTATACALQKAWSSDKDRDWVNELWREAFTYDTAEPPEETGQEPTLCAPKKPEPHVQSRLVAPDWGTLADLIRRSSKGKSMSVGPGLKDGPAKVQPPAPTTNTTVKTATAGNEAGVAISSILPSQQSELAVLLECKRALELCDTARHMHGHAEEAAKIEVDSALKAQAKDKANCDGQRPLNLRTQLKAAYDRYQLEEQNAKRAYLNGGVCQKPPQRQATATTDPASLGGSTRTGLEEGLHDPLDTYEASNQTQNSETDQNTAESRLSQAFFALQGSPTLSRLFGLTIDVKIPATELERVLDPKTQASLTAPDGGRFLYLGVNEGSLCRNPGSCTVFTIAKYRADPARPHFWPTTAMEVGLGPDFDPEYLFDLPQYDGVVVAGQKLTAVKKTEEGKEVKKIVDGKETSETVTVTVPRFELTSLDVRAAAEGALDRRDSTLAEKAIQQQINMATPSSRPATISRKTFTTAGLVVLDRGRQGQALAQFAARNVQVPKVETDKFIVLDANDLLTGYRLDVGVPLKGCSPTYAWRSLMAREMRYGTTGLHARRVRAIVQWLFLDDTGKSETERWRQVLEDGVLALPARLIPPATNNEQAAANAAGAPAAGDPQPAPPADQVVHAFVEEAIATWTGEPLSVTCSGPRDQKVRSPYGLPVGCVVALPTQKQDPLRRTPGLRFGWPYRVAIRPVYCGGISVPLSTAQDLYDRGRTTDFVLGGSVTIPAVPEGPFRRRDQLRRYLRHERVDAPYLLIPEANALRVLGPMGYERAARAVVRSAKGDMHERGQPAVTQRVFVVPSVSQSFAAMHAVFDYTHVEQPRDGLGAPRFGPQGVRFDALNGGFPVMTSAAITGINGVQFVSSRGVSTKTCVKTGDDGDLVYSTVKSERKRPVPYYPDPAACEYVIAVRIAGSSEYLEGGPCVIPVYAKGDRHPDARPLALTIQRMAPEAKRRSRPKLQDVLTWPKGSDARVAGHAWGAERIPGSVEAILSLAPGEDFEVDVWCIPDAAGLACRFALVETIGVLAFTRAKGDLTKATVCEVLGGLLPKFVCDRVEQCLSESNSDNDEIADWADGCRGLGGLHAPGPDTLQAIASALHDALSCRPLDEVAAIRTLRATYAVDRPLLEPRLGPHGCPTDAATASGDCACVELFRVKGASGKSDRLSGSGYVRIHLPTTGALEIGAELASPSSDKLDDPRRARSLRDRRLRRWPKDANKAPTSMRHIFGFDVTETGEVRLPRTHVVIQRLTDIPLLPKAERLEIGNDGTCDLPLSAVFGDSASDEKADGDKVGTPKPTFVFTDRLARLLYLTVKAYGRHADQMRKAPSRGKDGIWLRDGEGLPEKDSTITSRAVIPVWLNAAVRPSQPAARSPVPAFLWTDVPESKAHGKSVKTLARRMVIRIALGRPWFSSGEDERLGIVVWPPNLLAQDAALFDGDQVMTLPTHGEPGRQMNLEDFYDGDLGPGGKFITRWGGDPVRVPAEALESGDPPPGEARPYRRTFMPAAAFLDMKGDAGTGFRAQWVPNVSMPVIIADQESSADVTDDSQKSERVPQMLTVSLVTYVPKFDVENEQWYVDVAIEHPYEAEPFVRLGLVRYQPHAPPDLQVSYPVSQWTQLLPARKVQVTTTRFAHGANLMDVAVHIEGLVASLPEDSRDNESERRPVPKMITRIVREQTVRRGLTTKNVIAQQDLSAERLPLGDVPAYRVAWETSLGVPRTAGAEAGESCRYFVFVEETEALLPATYRSEPVDPDTAAGRDCHHKFVDDLLIERGPRFLAWIPLCD